MQVLPYNSFAFGFQSLRQNGPENHPYGPGRTGGAPALRQDADQSRTFAQDLTRRIADVPEEGAAHAGALESSLAKAMDFIRQRHGSQAATAAMGLVYKTVGNGPVTEENLSQGLLQAVRFLDRNFGFAAGDAAMAHFNGDLNQDINDTFRNGLSEHFFAVQPGQQNPLSLAMRQTADQVRERFGDEAAASVLDILEQGLEQGGIQGFLDALEESSRFLAEQYGGALPADAQAAAARALLPPEQTSPGSLVDLTV